LFKKYLHWQLKIYSHPSSSSFGNYQFNYNLHAIHVPKNQTYFSSVETSSSLWYKATSLYLKMKSEAVCKAFLNNILQDFEEYSPIVVQAIDCLGVFYESVEDFTVSVINEQYLFCNTIKFFLIILSTNIYLRNLLCHKKFTFI